MLSLKGFGTKDVSTRHFKRSHDHVSHQAHRTRNQFAIGSYLISLAVFIGVFIFTMSQSNVSTELLYEHQRGCRPVVPTMGTTDLNVTFTPFADRSDVMPDIDRSFNCEIGYSFLWDGSSSQCEQFFGLDHERIPVEADLIHGNIHRFSVVLRPRFPPKYHISAVCRYEIPPVGVIANITNSKFVPSFWKALSPNRTNWVYLQPFHPPRAFPLAIFSHSYADEFDLTRLCRKLQPSVPMICPRSWTNIVFMATTLTMAFVGPLSWLILTGMGVTFKWRHLRANLADSTEISPSPPSRHFSLSSVRNPIDATCQGYASDSQGTQLPVRVDIEKVGSLESTQHTPATGEVGHDGGEEQGLYRGCSFEKDRHTRNPSFCLDSGGWELNRDGDDDCQEV